MLKQRTFISLIFILIIINVVTIFYYESKMKVFDDYYKIIGEDQRKKYNVNEIKSLIYSDSLYIGDSIQIFKNGEIKSSNQKFQYTINAYYMNNKDYIETESQINGVPKPLIIYKNSAYYYRLENPDEFKTK